MSQVTETFLDVKEFTRDVVKAPDSDSYMAVTGNGVFDVIMHTVTLHLDAQLNNDRINGESYAKLYSEALGACLSTSVQLITTILQKELLEAQVENEKAKLPLIEAQVELVKAQIENEKAKLATELAKQALYERQTKGFNDDAKLRLLKTLYDPYGVAFSVAKDSTELVPPSSITKSVLDSIVKDLTAFSNLGGQGGAIVIEDNPL